MFDSETLNQLQDKPKKGQRNRYQHHVSKGAEKGRTSAQPDRNGRGARNQTGRAAQERREAKRSRSEEPEEQAEPQVQLEGEC